MSGILPYIPLRDTPQLPGLAMGKRELLLGQQPVVQAGRFSLPTNPQSIAKTIGSICIGGIGLKGVLSLLDTIGFQIRFTSLAVRGVTIEWTKLMSIVMIPVSLFTFYNSAMDFINQKIDGKIDALLTMVAETGNITEGVTKVLAVLASFGVLALTSAMVIAGNVGWGIAALASTTNGARGWYQSQKFSTFLDDFMNKKISKKHILEALRQQVELSTVITTHHFDKKEDVSPLDDHKKFKRVKWLIETMKEHDSYQVNKYFGENADTLLDRINEVWLEAHVMAARKPESQIPKHVFKIHYKLPTAVEEKFVQIIESVNDLQCNKRSKIAKTIKGHLNTFRRLKKFYDKTGNDSLIPLMHQEFDQILNRISPFLSVEKQLCRKRNAFTIDRNKIIPQTSQKIPKVYEGVDLSLLKETDQPRIAMRAINDAVKQRALDRITSYQLCFAGGLLSLATLLCLALPPTHIAGYPLGILLGGALMGKFFYNTKVAKVFRERMGLSNRKLAIEISNSDISTGSY